MSDFGYSDALDAVTSIGPQASRLPAGETPALPNNFVAVTIGSLPVAGVLSHNGVFVLTGQSISAAEAI